MSGGGAPRVARSFGALKLGPGVGYAFLAVRSLGLKRLYTYMRFLVFRHNLDEIRDRRKFGS